MRQSGAGLRASARSTSRAPRPRCPRVRRPSALCASCAARSWTCPGLRYCCPATSSRAKSDVRAQFQAARDDEYEEIVDKCADFIAGIDKEYRESHFSYAELEENEVDLVKLRTWLQRVRDRDVFGAAGLQQAVSSLAECEEKLEAYAARVYAEEAEGH